MSEQFSASNLLTDCRNVAEVLRRAGFAPEQAYDKAALFASAAALLPPTDRPLALYIPGRLEVLGKHTDYAGGRSLVAAVERGLCVVAAERGDGIFQVTDAATRERRSCAIAPEAQAPAGDWGNYPATVARRVARNFGPGPRGVEMVFASDLPAAAGMSSSSALMIACFFALAHVNGLFGRPQYAENIRGHEDLAGYLATVENGQSFGGLEGNRGVGTFGGSEDHTAILTCEPGRLRQYSYAPVRFERSIGMPPGWVFAVAASGVAAEKTGGAMERYNRASRLARLAVEKWNAASGRSDAHLGAAVASAPDGAQRVRTALADAPELLERFEQFEAESERIVPQAGDALERGDLGAFGALVERSQELAETKLGNQVPQTMHLARSARRLGAAAASAFGAGFGGSVWALVEAGSAERFLADWEADYRGAFGEVGDGSRFFVTGAGPGAARLFA